MNTNKLLRLVSTASRKNALTSRNLSAAVAVKVPSLFMDYRTACESPTSLHSFTNTSTSRRTMSMVTKTKVEDMPKAVPQEAGESSAPVRDSSAPSPDAAATSTEAVLVTPSCWKRIRSLASKKEKSLDELYLRVYVDSGGCSGFSYAFEISEEELEEDDIVFFEPATLGSEDGLSARVVIDEGSLEMLRGSSIDYVQEMIRSTFTVKDNPLSESACGCGSSFAVKNFSSNPALD
jgi:iron-sulfur cluster assembly accessory protein